MGCLPEETTSGGQVVDVPSHFSSTSQKPRRARHTMPAPPPRSAGHNVDYWCNIIKITVKQQQQLPTHLAIAILGNVTHASLGATQHTDVLRLRILATTGRVARTDRTWRSVQTVASFGTFDGARNTLAVGVAGRHCRRAARRTLGALWLVMLCRTYYLLLLLLLLLSTNCCRVERTCSGAIAHFILITRLVAISLQIRMTNLQKQLQTHSKKTKTHMTTDVAGVAKLVGRTRDVARVAMLCHVALATRWSTHITAIKHLLTSNVDHHHNNNNNNKHPLSSD
jgi:hypothetical protein